MHRFFFASLLLILSILPAQTSANRADHVKLENIRKAISEYLTQDLRQDPDMTATYSVSSIPISGGARYITIAYIAGSQSTCGSGGCLMLVLEKNGEKWRIIGDTPIVNLPITSLGFSSNGYPIIGVWVQGGGVTRGYQAKLAFDGQRYPDNPSTAPRATSRIHHNRNVLIDSHSRKYRVFERR